MHGDAVSGEPVAVDTDAVAAGPALPAAAQRHAHTTTPLAPPGVRVVTYNVLADQYASTDYAQEHLFAYCPRECAILHSQHLITALSSVLIYPHFYSEVHHVFLLPLLAHTEEPFMPSSAV